MRFGGLHPVGVRDAPRGDHGYLAAQKAPGRTRQRTHYKLTERGVEAIRAWMKEPAQLDLAEEVAHTIPHKERYLLLNHALARRIVDAHAEWLDEVERELGES